MPSEDEEKVKEIRRKKRVRSRFSQVMSDLAMYGVYVMLLLMICADVRDDRSILQNNAARGNIYSNFENMVSEKINMFANFPLRHCL